MTRFVRILASAAILCSTSCGGPKVFSPVDSGFSVNMPGTPTERVGTGGTAGYEVTMHLFVFDAGQRAYLAGYGDYKNAQGKSVELTNALKNALMKKGMPGHVTEEEVSVDGTKGVEIALNDAEGRFIKERIFVVESRAFQAAVYTDANHSNSPEIDQYLRSFQLKQARNSRFTDQYEPVITLLIPLAWTLGFFATLFAFYRKYKYYPYEAKWPLVAPVAALSAGMLAIPFFLAVMPRLTHLSSAHYYPHTKVAAGILFLLGLLFAVYLIRKYPPPSVNLLQPR